MCQDVTSLADSLCVVQCFLHVLYHKKRYSEFYCYSCAFAFGFPGNVESCERLRSMHAPRIVCRDIGAEDLAVLQIDEQPTTVGDVCEQLEARGYQEFQLILVADILRDPAQQLLGDTNLSVVWPCAKARQVNLALADLCHANLRKVVEELSGVGLKTEHDLHTLVRISLKMALRAPDQSDMFVDIFHDLQNRLPHGGDAEVNFSKVLLERCQEEFETLVRHSEGLHGKVDSIRALLKIICSLYTRRLLSGWVIMVIVRDLLHPVTGCTPSAEGFALTDEALRAVGEVLARDRRGADRIRNICAHLEKIAAAKTPDGESPQSERVQSLLQFLRQLPMQDEGKHADDK
eukprot:TRINITY_DN36950_c0_g1_i1.p1 TRINITY_DN36950_c0_g1~~TRINITY_DN36950_c0_g1_i1.p1  ORF type:complete len:347 (-),score=35.23 TRINITY_DN36950_c0_g1_i1:444-1484(-)